MTKLADKLQKCYDVFPFGFNGIRVHENWAYSGAFAAKLVGHPEAVDISMLKGLGIYKEDQSERTKKELEKIIGTTDLHETKVFKEKHSDYCSGRAVESSITEKIEIAWVFWDLAQALGVNSWKQSAAVLYGYNNGELVFVCAGRYMVDDCFIPRGQSKKQWKLTGGATREDFHRHLPDALYPPAGSRLIMRVGRLG